MKTFPSLLVLFTLMGCAVTSKVMINEQGKQVHCGSWGVGVIGTSVADASYLDCVKQQKALGFVDLEDFEKTEPAKIEKRSGVMPPKESSPLWETGYVWSYRLSGTKNGVSRQEVTGKDLVKGLTAYVLRLGETTILYSEELNTIQIQEKGTITATYTPPLQSYVWPLEVGKTWHAQGELETRTGKLNLSTHFEVKDYGIVRVPAGEFEAFYLLSKSDNGSRISEVWYSPKVRRHVKLVTYSNEGRLAAELTAYSTGPSVPTPLAIPTRPQEASPEPSAPAPTSPSVRQESLAPPAPAATPAPPSGPWLGVPLGTPDQQTLNRVGSRPGRGAVVLPFTKNPNLPPVDLAPGDVILAIEGVDIEGPGHVAALLAGRNPGSTVRVRVFRGQDQRQVEQPMVIFLGRP